jgi:RHS repeat-associated protein
LPETGLQKTLTDPNAGTNSYDYNVYGELTSQTDGNSKNTIIQYDKLGRIYTKTLGSIVTTYYYDPAGALGQIDHITKTDGSGMAYTYDGLARVATETRSKGSNAFTYIYQYDSKSRVSTLTYPNNMKLTYGYNAISGDLTSITKDGTAIWSLGITTADVNDLGQIAKVTLGNGKATLYGYDTQNRLNSITATNIVNFGYEFNNQQQLKHRDEYMFDGTSMKGFVETFTYDGVNRLRTATKDNGNTPLTMVYKTGVNDRIDSKSDAGTYVYNETTNHCIDQLNTVGSYSPPRHDLTYNDEGKTTIITETNNSVVNKTLTLEYGLDGDRFKTEYTQDGSRKYTRYYDDTYEKEVMTDGTTHHLNYIYAGNTLFAIFEQKTGGDKMHYVYTDRQGSLRCITDASGAIEQRLSYDAYGNRRDYQTGLKLTDTQLVAAIALTSRGYIGQEHIDGLALININARFYDPTLGLFVSPDNYVQSLDNSQNFNRFTYCLNNPLMFTDPSGNFFWMPVIIGAVMGGMMQGMQADVMRDDFWGGAWRGAVVGAVGGYFSNFGGGSFVNNVLWGAGEGAITGGLNAGLNNGNISKGILYGAAIGGIFAAATSGLECYDNYSSGKGYGFKTNDVVLKGLSDNGYCQEAIDYTVDKYGMRIDYQGKKVNYFYEEDLEYRGQVQNFDIDIPGLVRAKGIYIGGSAFDSPSGLKGTLVHEWGHWLKDRILDANGDVIGLNYPHYSFEPKYWSKGRHSYDLLNFDGPIGYAQQIYNSGRLHLSGEVLTSERLNPLWKEWSKGWKLFYTIPQRFVSPVIIKYY